MNGEQKTTKTCRFCYQEIDKRAKRCPYCASAQAWVFYVPVGLIAVMIVWLLLVGMMYRGARSLFSSGVPFADHRDEMEVVESHMFFGEDNCGRKIATVVGIIRNSGDIAWREVSVEVRFLGGDGALLDTDLDHGFDRSIMPHGDAAFKARAVLHRPEEDYVSHKVLVRDARDAKAKWPL